MSTLFSDPVPTSKTAQIFAFSYPEIGSAVDSIAECVSPDPTPLQENAPQGPSQAEIQAMIEKARLEAIAQTEKRMQAELELRIREKGQLVETAIAEFAGERSEYFARVEADVVRLSLAIARRILHREAQVDPLIVAALVRVALEKIKTQSGISVRTSPEDTEKWRAHLADVSERVSVSFVPDPQLRPGECVLETEMGSTDLGIEAQMTEVEKGFFDLLAQRPGAS